MIKPPERFAPEWHGFLRSFAYDFDARAGKFILTDGCICDRVSAVELFRAIDPEVRRIEIYFSDGERCACYVRHERAGFKNGFWRRALANWHKGKEASACPEKTDASANGHAGL